MIEVVDNCSFFRWSAASQFMACQ